MKLYENLAKTYNLRHNSPSTLYLRKWENKVLKKYAKGKILDVGCGTGYHLDFLKLLGRDVVGIDSSKEMIALCKSPAIIADANNLPFEDKSFDAALCMFSTMNMLDEKAIKEIYRVLNNKGVLIISVASIWDKKYPSFNEKRKLVVEDYMKKKAVHIDKNILDFRLFTKESLIQIMEKHGFMLKKFQGIFIHQRPYWGRFEDFSLYEKFGLCFDKFQFFNNLGTMYIAVFRKNE